MITGRQIRAARGLLAWKAEDLARRAEVARETISKIESDAVQPHEKTMAAIARVFDENGVEFTDNQGVRLKPKSIEVYEGTTGFRKFMDDIYDVARQGDAEICVSGVEEKVFHEHLGEEFGQMHIKRMTDLKEKVKVRCIVHDGDSEVYCESYNEYRWAPSEFFSAVPFYVYGDKFAVIIFEGNEVTIVVIESRPVAKAYRKQFDIIWKNSKAPNFKKP